MRIQETDRILKEARQARTAVARQDHHEGFMTRAWKSISSLPNRVTELFRGRG
jgi:hypothetical protein